MCNTCQKAVLQCKTHWIPLVSMRLPERRTAAETAGEAGGEALAPSRAEAATVASCNSALAAAI
eukprot:3035082-Prymnesium_polylepis.1